MSEPFYDQPDFPRRALVVAKGASDEETARNHAAFYLSPELAAGRAVAQTVPPQLSGPMDLIAICDELRSHAEAINRGDLSRPEAMLMGQAQALESLWVRLLERGMEQKHAEHHDQLMRLALKAQAQSVRTLEVLAAIKQPPVVFATQANVTTGPQQVNNAPPRPREVRTRPTQLSRGDNELLQNNRAARAAVPADPPLEAVGEVHRPAHRRR